MPARVRRCGPAADCRALAELVLRHKNGIVQDHYEIAERLAEKLRLTPRERLVLRQELRHYLEGTYLRVVRDPGGVRG